MAKPLEEWTDDELDKFMATKAVHTSFSYNDVRGEKEHRRLRHQFEIDQERLRRDSDRDHRLSLTAIIISVLSLLATIAANVISALMQKP